MARDAPCIEITQARAASSMTGARETTTNAAAARHDARAEGSGARCRLRVVRCMMTQQMTAVMRVETPSYHRVVLPPSARDKRLQQSSNIKSLKKGGAGESGFCYEAGASVEVAPEEALLTAPLATAASVEPEALPAVLHARTSARGRERRGGAAAPSRSQGCEGEVREH